MKAIVWTRYGSPEGLKLQEVEKPTPRDHEILVKVHAATVAAGDCEVRSLGFPLALQIPMRLYMGVIHPRNIILGQEVAGEVVEVGKDVTQFKPGDAIYAVTGVGFGGYAEYIRLTAAEGVALKPANMTYAEAAAVPTGGLEALHFIRKANIQPGQQVLIIGGGGSIGSFAIQLAKAAGAEVTGVDRTEKLDTLRAAGADHAVDYTREDYLSSGQTYDVIVDVVGKSPFGRCLRVLKAHGYYLLVNSGLVQRVRGLWTSATSDKTVVTGSAPQRAEDLVYLKGLIEAGKVKAIIDRSYSLEQIPEGHAYVDTGMKKGNVVVNVVPESNT